MKNVLITGGAGFIGMHLSRKLILEGFNVTVLDNLSPQVHGYEKKILFKQKEIFSLGLRYIEGSVTCRKDWLKALECQDAVVHLAAETGTGQSMYQIDKYSNTNIRGTSLLLDILANKKHSVSKIVVASSRAIYGEGKYYCPHHNFVYPISRREDDMRKRDFECKCPMCSNQLQLIPTDEESKIHPTSIYGITKQAQEQMILNVGKTLGISCAALRYQNVYGPGQSLANPYTGILSIFSTQIKNENDINIYEDGKESRDFVYIEDVVEATYLCLVNERIIHDVFNVGSNELVNITTVATLLKEYYNSSININVLHNYRLGDIRHNYADLAKIKRKLGFSPLMSFQNGLKAFCEWVEKQEVQIDGYELSVRRMKKVGVYK
jgi:dTDP-L-rhamnose 4-epimerase